MCKPGAPAGWTLGVNLLLLPVTWAGFLLDWTLALPTLLLALLVGACGPRPRRGLALAALLSPFVVTPVLTIGSSANRFWKGTARLARSAEPALYVAGLGRGVDRETRYPLGGSGSCTPSGIDQLGRPVNDATLRALRYAFGPMGGAYQGVFPTPAQTRALLGTAPDAVYEPGALLRGSLQLPGLAYSFDADLLAAVRGALRPASRSLLAVWVLNGECLVIACVDLEPGVLLRVLLLDARAPRLLAGYWVDPLGAEAGAELRAQLRRGMRERGAAAARVPGEARPEAR
ncbi:MAG: hypothetical protein KDD82_18180 [Planctomycetes bacterium]|nr:hypothetical protein [Planctomycetota bacterium]